ncbi:MAG TPA: hypothetical protein VKQ08_01580, partial [Cyclobacteriaceae bacterium]|nr:hypothetical protein [Cyclobacteriaceae bacterium]
MSTVTSDIGLKENIVQAFEGTGGARLQNRREAIAHFQRMGLPGNKSEEYRFTPIARALERNFDFTQTATAPKINSVDPFLIPDLDANVLVFINGIYAAGFSGVSSPESEIRISKLKDALENGAALPYYERHLRTAVDPFSALNAAFWQDGLFVQVPAKARVEKPLLLLHVNDSTRGQ